MQQIPNSEKLDFENSDSENSDSEKFETPTCFLCGSDEHDFFISAQDDLTGKPGIFNFVRCKSCYLVYQRPRLRFEFIGSYYDDEYISHRKKTDWGWLTPFYEHAMGKHDRDKLALAQQYQTLNSHSRVLDIGCGSGSFLNHVHEQTGAQVTGVDFKNLQELPTMKHVDFRHGVLEQQAFSDKKFDLITMWHFLEHDYQAERTLQIARRLLSENGRLIIEVPCLDSLTFRWFKNRWPGLQAPQHTALFTTSSLKQLADKVDIEILAQMPYGAFPPYFYIFTGLAFKRLKGRGLNLQKAVLPYFLGQLLCLPFLMLMKKRNLAMQTLVGRR